MYKLVAADVGAQIRIVITATNAAGSASAASAASVSILAVTPTAAQVKALLLKEITPAGKAAKIAALLKAGGVTISFRALSAGTAAVDWYYVPAGAHIAKAKPKAVRVGSGSLAFNAAGTGRLKIKLTAAGRKLLKKEQIAHAKLLRITAQGTFKPTGGASIVVQKSFTPSR